MNAGTTMVRLQKNTSTWPNFAVQLTADMRLELGAWTIPDMEVPGRRMFPLCRDDAAAAGSLRQSGPIGGLKSDGGWATITFSRVPCNDALSMKCNDLFWCFVWISNSSGSGQMLFFYQMNMIMRTTNPLFSPYHYGPVWMACFFTPKIPSCQVDTRIRAYLNGRAVTESSASRERFPMSKVGPTAGVPICRCQLSYQLHGRLQ
ncbi:hypothetical protein V8F06_001405 [Rhypophila decipiens]